MNYLKAMGYSSLTGAPLERYLKMLRELVAPVALSRFYPDLGAFTHALQLWDPLLEPKLNATLDIDEGSGLPFESAYTRLTNERELYQREFAQGRCSARKLSSPFFRELIQGPLPQKHYLTLEQATSPEGASHPVRFRAVLDRYDLSKGLLARYTVDFTSPEAVGSARMATWEEWDRTPTAPLAAALSLACQDEAELALLSLSTLKSIRVLRLVRGRIGPLYRRGAAPHFLEPLFERLSGATLLNFPLDGVSTTRRQDLNLDPFSGLFRHTLSAKSKQALDQLAAQLKYRVIKERRLSLWGEDAEKLALELKKRSRYVHIFDRGRRYPWH